MKTIFHGPWKGKEKPLSPRAIPSSVFAHHFFIKLSLVQDYFFYIDCSRGDILICLDGLLPFKSHLWWQANVHLYLRSQRQSGRYTFLCLRVTLQKAGEPMFHRHPHISTLPVFSMQNFRTFTFCKILAERGPSRAFCKGRLPSTPCEWSWYIKVCLIFDFVAIFLFLGGVQFKIPDMRQDYSEK